MNLLLDIFAMPVIFFISGYFTPESLKRKGNTRFLKRKFRRLMVPWIIALFTLIPIYNIIFLYSRGMPQGDWTKYFHFTNGTISMSWLWFLPVLFLFDLLYILLRKLNIPTGRLSMAWAVTTFKYYLNRQGRLGRNLGRISYSVYIIHIIVMGPIAVALLHLDLPGLVKYPILALSTYLGSNLIAYLYARARAA